MSPRRVSPPQPNPGAPRRRARAALARERGRFVVGIDLGTTHCVLAWAQVDLGPNPPIHVLQIPQLVARGELGEDRVLASALYAPLPEEGVREPLLESPWIAGDFARRRGQEAPSRLVSSAKSWLSHAGVDRTATILPWGAGDEPTTPRLSPVDASSRLLKQLEAAWARAMPEHPLSEQTVVLTVPASFDPVARELTLRAAQDAGLAVRLLEEPQAAFYDHLQRTGTAELEAVLEDGTSAFVLVCDVGGGTTDLTLIRLSRSPAAGLDISRAAVGRHLLLGGDNMDLALAHLCEPRLVAPPDRLDARSFAELILACRQAKEELLVEGAPPEVAVTVLGRGSALLGSARTTSLTRDEVSRVVLDGFFTRVSRDTRPQRTRGALVAFGLPYEQDPAITRHVAGFLARHAADSPAPAALLFNGGVFRAGVVRERMAEVVSSWGGSARLLTLADPDLAVARGAVAYGLALSSGGRTIGGGSAHGYYVGVVRGEAGRERAALSVVPRGAREGERHVASARPLALRIGTAARFELYASDDDVVHAPGTVVDLDLERLEPLPPVTTALGTEGPGEEIAILLEGELTPVGTVELACVEQPRTGAAPRRFRLAFDLRAPEVPAPDAGRRPRPARTSVRALGTRLDDAKDAIDRAFGKGRSDVGPREAKDLLRTLEKTLGERANWTVDVDRALFDALVPGHKGRRRSADHERVFWMLAGYCLRPGFGYPLDHERVTKLAALFPENLAFSQENRGWQQFFIAWRRVAGGLAEAAQVRIRDALDPFLAPAEVKLKKPKGFRPLAPDELLELASWLERVPVERRAELGRWLLERTWTSRDARLWSALGRIGARVPAYASAHHVVPPGVAERWLDHLLREKWEEVPTAPRTAFQLARVTGDRARDVSEAIRRDVERRLVRAGADPVWVQGVRELVRVEEAERAALFGEELPVGLRLVDAE